jgi:NodT family efflux transporter outer membrane factor (OMF) lipoprotein
MRSSFWNLLSCTGVVAALVSCAVGPDYKKPDAPLPVQFKDPGPAQGGAAPPMWKPGQPRDTADRGAWWLVFGDGQLDRLEREVAISNQNVKSYEAQYRQAVALVDEARSEFFPVVSVTAGVQRGGGGGGTSSISSALGSGAGGSAKTQYRLEPSISWSPDLWGSIRRQLESRKAGAQLSAADLANALLSAQATLASDYFSLRATDANRVLIATSVQEYQRALDITQNQFHAGTAAASDVATARAQLLAAQAQQVVLDQQRGTYEHAIAVLAGRLPENLDVDAGPLPTSVPVVPMELPSTLLERNPAIAAAERQMQEENALIGVAVAAYFPQITLSGLGGYAGDPLSELFKTGSRIWSLGASATETVFDAGNRGAQVDAARATYDEAVANYRQTVLTGFQQVEDELLAMRVYERQAQLQDLAVRAAHQATEVARNEFDAGTVAYTTVSQARQTEIADEQNALTIQENRLLACVGLIAALGGGWDVNQLPTP